MSDEMKFTFSCKACGADPTSLDLPDNYNDDSIAKCSKCGFEFGRYGEIKALAIKQGKAELNKMVKDAFKGVKGWKIK